MGYEGYRKFTTKNVKNSQVDGSVLVERMLGLENEIEDLRKQNNAMLVKYSYAYGRKDDYKDKFLNLEKSSEENKKASEEAIKLWKDKAEKEEGEKLRIQIARELELQKAETIEVRENDLWKITII